MVNGRFTRFTMNPGASAQRTGTLPHALEQIDLGRRHRLGLRSRDHLDEAHHGRRVEEVRADHALRRPHTPADVGDGQRARVGRRGSVGLRRRVERPEHVLLELRMLGRRLEDDPEPCLRAQRLEGVRVAHVGETPVDPVVDRVGVQVQLGGAPREAITDYRWTPRSRAISSTSYSTTSWPASSATCPMPAPIVPAPTTPTTASSPAIGRW